MYSYRQPNYHAVVVPDTLIAVDVPYPFVAVSVNVYVLLAVNPYSVNGDPLKFCEIVNPPPDGTARNV